MPEKLKIPGRIVAMSETDHYLTICTETQVYALHYRNKKCEPPLLIFDITDYQDKPTEKELEEKKKKEEMREIRRNLLEDCVETVRLQIAAEMDLYHCSISDSIAAIAELNRMDGYHG